MKQRRTKRHAACVIETETAFLPPSLSASLRSSPFRFPSFPPYRAIELHSPESRRLDHPHLDGQTASAGYEALAKGTGPTGVL